MLEYGQGVPADLEKAYAWAYVSAEVGQQPLVDYFHQLQDTLTGEQRSKADELAQEYMIKYGLFAQAARAQKVICEELKSGIY